MKAVTLVSMISLWFSGHIYAQKDTTRSKEYILPRIVVDAQIDAEPLDRMAEKFASYDKIKEMVTTDPSIQPVFVGGTRFARNGLDSRKLPVILYIGNVPYRISNPLETFQSAFSTAGNWNTEIRQIPNQPGMGVLALTQNTQKRHQIRLSPLQQTLDLTDEHTGLYFGHNGTSGIEKILPELGAFPDEIQTNTFFRTGEDIKLDILVRGMYSKNTFDDDENRIAEMDRLEENRTEGLAIVNLAIPMENYRLNFGLQGEGFKARTKKTYGEEIESIEGLTSHFMVQALIENDNLQMGCSRDYLQNEAFFKTHVGRYGGDDIKQVSRVFASVKIPYENGVLNFTAEAVHDEVTAFPLGVNIAHSFELFGIDAIIYGGAGTHYNALRTNNTIVYDIVNVERLDNHRGEEASMTLELRVLGGKISIEGYYSTLRFDKGGIQKAAGINLAYSNDYMMLKVNSGNAKKETRFATLPVEDVSELTIMLGGRVPLDNWELFGQVMYTDGVHVPLRNDGIYEWSDKHQRYVKVENTLAKVSKNIYNGSVGVSYDTKFLGNPLTLTLNVTNIDLTFSGRYPGVGAYLQSKRMPNTKPPKVYEKQVKTPVVFFTGTYEF